MAAGLGAGFVCAQFLSLKGRCYVLLVTVVVALVSDILLEFLTQPREALLPWFLRPKKYSAVMIATEDKEEDEEPPLG